MQISIVPAEYVASVWPDIEQYMQGAAEYTYGRFTVEDIKEGLLSKPHQLWIAFDDRKIYGAVVTEISEYPQLKALVMHFTGGIKLNEWKNEMLQMLQRFGKDCGCTIIESYGRPGWEKVFKDDGFKSRFVFYELPVEN